MKKFNSMEAIENNIKNCFINGPIDSSFIGESIKKHQLKTNIGAHQIFLGQVRADKIKNKEVTAIEYSAHQQISNQILHEIKENTFNKFDLISVHIYHSLGIVKKGEICLFVFASSAHRKNAQKAIEFLVEQIKSKTPIFGKEHFSDQTHQWKVNK